jgi:hypothetical protein
MDAAEGDRRATPAGARSELAAAKRRAPDWKETAGGRRLSDVTERVAAWRTGCSLSQMLACAHYGRGACWANTQLSGASVRSRARMSRTPPTG